jgi:hypothetical protein
MIVENKFFSEIQQHSKNVAPNVHKHIRICQPSSETASEDKGQLDAKQLNSTDKLNVFRDVRRKQ